MASRELPILVAHLSASQARALGCSTCGMEREAAEEEITVCDPCWACETDACDGYLQWVYFEGDACPNCGNLGFWPKVLKGCCTRVCQLQHEYAEQLKASRA